MWGSAGVGGGETTPWEAALSFLSSGPVLFSSTRFQDASRISSVLSFITRQRLILGRRRNVRCANIALVSSAMDVASVFCSLFTRTFIRRSCKICPMVNHQLRYDRSVEERVLTRTTANLHRQPNSSAASLTRRRIASRGRVVFGRTITKGLTPMSRRAIVTSVHIIKGVRTFVRRVTVASGHLPTEVNHAISRCIFASRVIVSSFSSHVVSLVIGVLQFNDGSDAVRSTIPLSRADSARSASVERSLTIVASFCVLVSMYGQVSNCIHSWLHTYVRVDWQAGRGGLLLGYRLLFALFHRQQRCVG